MREMPEAKLVVVQAFNKEWEAEMAKSALKAAGIDAMIRADSVGGTRPHVAWASGGFELLVFEENAAAARGVLEAPKKRA